MALLDKVGYHHLGIAHTAVFPVVARLEDAFGIHHPELRLLGTRKHVERAHGTRDVERKHDVYAVGIRVFHLHRVLRAGKRHHEAAQGGKAQGGHDMAQAHAAAGHGLLRYGERGKLDGTLAALLAVNIQCDKDGNKNKQPEGFGILKMKSTNIHILLQKLPGVRTPHEEYTKNRDPKAAALFKFERVDYLTAIVWTLPPTRTRYVPLFGTVMP